MPVEIVWPDVEPKDIYDQWSSWRCQRCGMDSHGDLLAYPQKGRSWTSDFRILCRDQDACAKRMAIVQEISLLWDRYWAVAAMGKGEMQK